MASCPLPDSHKGGFRTGLPWAFLTLCIASHARGDFVFTLRDENGSEIRKPISICLRRASESRCTATAPYEFTSDWEDFDSVVAEGDFHGPVEAKRSSLPIGARTRFELTIPRKAALTLTPRPPAGSTLSLYRPNDSTFRSPSFRMKTGDADQVFVGAGDYVLSLADGTHAPNLHFVSLKPGESRRLEHRLVPGWSLLLRCVASGTGKPVTNASVGITVSDSPPRPSTPARKDEKWGLVALTGLREPFVSAVVQAPGFLPKDVKGIAAGFGTFAYRETQLERGGSLAVLVRLNSSPATGIACALLDILGPHGTNLSQPQPLASGMTGTDGVFRAREIRPGRYVLRATPASGNAGVDEIVSIIDEQLSTVTLDLVQIRVTGRVDRGGEPASGYQVEIHRLGTSSMTDRDAPAVATTDEEGNYKNTLWGAGQYWFIVQPPDGPPADSKREWIGTEDILVDFHLQRGRVLGTVVDDRDQPVADAAVLLSLNSNTRRGLTDSAGRFEFAVGEAGSARVRALKRGYRASDETVVALGGDADVTIALRLSKPRSLQGLVVGEDGVPRPGAAVTTFVQNPLGAAILDAQSTDPVGHFDVGRATAITFLSVTGPLCPLKIMAIAEDRDDVTVVCSNASSALNVVLKDDRGRPLANEGLQFRQNGIPIPRAILLQHLRLLGLPVDTDGSGFMAFVLLEPGQYELFLMSASSDETVAAGLSTGFLSVVTLSPNRTAELEIHVETGASAH